MDKRKTLTISDVARFCGLSKATVSKAMNLPPGECPLRYETQQKVLKAAAKLGYKPNWRAKALASQRSHTIGLFYMPPTPQMTGVYERIFKAFIQVIGEAGYHLLYIPVSSNHEDWSQILLSNRIDGCVVIESVPEMAQGALLESAVPTVLINAECDLPLPRVVVDDRDGARQITRHLIGLGHRRIGFYYGDASLSHYSIHCRIDGYSDAMREAGLAEHVDVIKGHDIDELVDNFVLSGKKLTALVTYTHHHAVDVLRAMQLRGRRVPDELSLATFNDIYPLECLVPAITTVALPEQWIGQVAADLLLKQMHSAVPKEQQVITLGEKLVLRESTARPRSEV